MAGREQQVEQMLRTQGLSVSGLKVQDHGNVVAIWGSVGDEQTKQQIEKVVEDTMKVKVANHLQAKTGTVASMPAARADGSPGGSAVAGGSYVVKSGDSLSKIAKRAYGDASKWTLIHKANAAKIPNPDLIHPGLELSIPKE